MKARMNVCDLTLNYDAHIEFVRQRDLPLTTDADARDASHLFSCFQLMLLLFLLYSQPNNLSAGRLRVRDAKALFESASVIFFLVPWLLITCGWLRCIICKSIQSARIWPGFL